MISMDELMYSPEFIRDIVIERTTGGGYVKSVYTSTTTRITLQGILNPDVTKSVTPSPEGSRATGQMTAFFPEATEIYTTRDVDGKNNIADMIVLDAGTSYESSYRIISVNSEYGFKKVTAERVGAA